MNILICTGLREELRSFFTLHPFEYSREAGCYRSSREEGLFAITTGPGFLGKKRFMKCLKLLRPRIIVNAGLVGVLYEKHGIEIGEKIELANVIDSMSRIVYPGGPGKRTLVTVSHPVFEPLEKMNLHLEHNAHACDMEAAVLLKNLGLGDRHPDENLVVFCKVAGDLPEHYLIFRDEELTHGWDRLTFVEKLKKGFRFPGGPLRLKKLLNHKDFALKSLARHLNRTVNTVLENGGSTDNLDSIFYPPDHRKEYKPRESFET